MSISPDIDDVADDWALLPGGRDQRRRLIARSVLNVLLATIGLLLLYAFVPVPGSSGVGPLLGMLGGFAVFVVITAGQIRSIARSPHPMLRALEVIAFSILLLVVVFAFTYLSLSRNETGSFTEELSRIDAMYYSVTTVSTVGPGDITPDSEAARVLVSVQVLLSLVAVGFVVRLVILAMRAGLHRQGRSAALGGSGED